MLATHPAACTRLEAEDDESFVDQVLLESLRLYPPIWIVERRAVRDDQLGGTKIPRRASVVVSPYVLHRQPTYWDAPDAFRPERFVGGEPPDEAKRVYLPFGIGPRRCIGQHFAMVESRLVLATLARRFRLEPVSGHVVVPEPGITLRLRDGLPMRIHRR